MKITDPVWGNRDHTVITVYVDFEDARFGTVGPVLFNAHRDDPHNHGREIFERAESGEFGPVGEWGAS